MNNHMKQSDLDPREHQIGSRLEEIRADHTERYRFAVQHIQPGSRVLDIACGVGYGAFLLARDAEPKEVVAVDISEQAVQHGRKYFDHPRIRWLVSDVFRVEQNLEAGSFDFVCTFETMEHLNDHSLYLETLSRLLKPGGDLLISTPNQDILPFDQTVFPYHARHYSSREFIRELKRHDFAVMKGYSQVFERIGYGFGGRFNIALCRKMDPYDLIGNPHIRHYKELLKNESLDSDFFIRFGNAEARRLMELGEDDIAQWLLEQSALADESNPEPCYLLGFLYKKNGDISRAVYHFNQAASLKATDKNKQFIVSSLFNLAECSKTREEKRNYLNKCLELEPEHRKANEALNRL